MKFTQLVKRGSNVVLAASMIITSFAGLGHQTVTVSANEIVATNAVQGRNVRNLNLTPGATNNEMRFTWHSGHETGAIRVWPAGNPDNYQYLVSTNVRPVEVHAGNANMGTAAAQNRVPTRPGFDYFLHQTAAYDLTAATTFEYVVITGGIESEIKTFRTGGEDRFQFAIGGDPQIGVGGQSLTLDGQGWANTVEVATRDFDLDFILSVGDQINTRNNQLTMSQQAHDYLFDIPQLNTLPLLPVVGNHDGSGAGNNNSRMWPFHYNLPMEGTSTRRFGQNFYTQFDYYMVWGDVLFLVIDTNTQTGFGPGGERLAFIEDAIERNSDANWIVATFHHATYPVYRDYATNAAIRNLAHGLVPQLERLGVDIVLNGHEHIYSRSHHMLNNVPQFDQQWLNEDAEIVSDPTGVNYNAVLDPTGLVHISVNTASGSGYRGARRFPRNYVAVYNQNWRRNVSVATVTPYKFSVATYQINDDSTRTLVDIYTIVRGDENGQVPSQLNKLRQANEQTFERVYTQLAPVTAASADALNLPETVIIETNIHNNDFLRRGQFATNRSQNSADYGNRVVPMYAPVSWDLSALEGASNETVTVTGTLDLENVISGRVNAGVWNNLTGGGANQFPAHPNARDLRTISVANPTNEAVTVEVQVTVGQAVDTPENPQEQDTLAISYFGAEFNFYGRTNAEFKYDAFNPAAFTQWQGRGATPIGFGGPRGGSGLTLATTIPLGTGSHQTGRNVAGNAAGGAVHTFTYFARTFYLPEYFDVNYMGEAFGTHRLDDNMVMFINGVEVYRANTATNASGNIRIGQPINWAAFAGQNTDAQNRSFTISEDVDHRNTGVANQANNAVTMHDAASRTNLESALRPGQNVLTVVVGNNSATSSDLWLDLDFVIEFEAPESAPIEDNYMDIQQVIGLWNTLATSDVAAGFVTNYNAEDFTAESWTAFYQSVRGAFELIARYANAPHQRPTVEGYYNRLRAGLDGLVVDTGYDFNRLMAFVAQVSEYVEREAEFTPESWAVAYRTAVETLRFVESFVGTRAQQLEVRDVYRAMRAAHDGLELLPVYVPTSPTPDHPEWTANTIFDTNDRVLYNGRVFEAQWWTQNQNPANSGPWGAWMEIGADVHIGYGVYAPEWTASRVFDNGDVVVHDGQVFRANWWTRNQAPRINDQWGPWTHIGSVE